MKIGMTSLTFRNDDIQHVFKYAKEAGIEGIEWGVHENHVRLCDSERIELIKELSKKYNIEIFSLGAYCDMTDFYECEKAVETAKMLEAPIIRIWAGKKASSECHEEYFNVLVENSKKMAESAKKAGIILCFEYHPNTITDNGDDAVRLVEAIDRENVGLYWQPQGDLSFEENKNAFETVKPYVLKNIHLNNYNKEYGYGYLEDISDDLRDYLKEADKEYNLLIEFVKDASFEALIRDSKAIKKILSER